MDFSGIVFMVARALRFALIVCAVYAAGRYACLKIKHVRADRRDELLRLLGVLYLAALVQIIALRGGPGSTRALRLTPFETTLTTLKAGPWPFVYNLVGNLIWFVPLGAMLRKAGPVRVLCASALLSLSLEALQWLLRTGVTDVDDVIINALGALLGWAAARIFSKHAKGLNKSGARCV